MTDVHDHEQLVDRLQLLGGALDLDEERTVGAVLQRIDTQRTPWRRQRWIAAAVVVLLALGVMLQPDARRAVARWFGLDGVVVEVDPDLPAGSRPASFELPGPGDSEIVQVGGRDVLLSAIDGRLTDGLIGKTVGSSEQLQQVEVRGGRGLWISGPAHQVAYEAANGDVVVERMATNTLLWEDGDVLFRVEGFTDLASALAFAEGT